MIRTLKKTYGYPSKKNSGVLKTNSKHILILIVIAQFCCTSLWFAGNGIVNDLIDSFHLDSNTIGNITAAVQLGFIFGTLSFAILTITDRFSPSSVFFVCAVLGALSNLGITMPSNSLVSLLTLRFLTGFFLAGIYPVGMKIAADYYEKGLGKALGFLVGALVLGTALPHLLKELMQAMEWKTVVFSTTSLAFFGGTLLVLFVKDGPFRKPSKKLQLSAFLTVFKNKNFKAAAFGYFGHMWELYAFWTFVPLMLETYKFNHKLDTLNTSLLSFFIIGIGAMGCIFSGYLSQSIQGRKVAFYSLLLSGLCCLVSPFFFTVDNTVIFIIFMLFWGVVVIADSPLFSTLVALNALPHLKGTALTIVNCIGFTITIFSIQLLNYLLQLHNASSTFLILALGPIFGLTALLRYRQGSSLNNKL